jgi:hypothetical protein
VAAVTKAELEARLAELEHENEHLRRVVDDQANGVVRDWLVAVDTFATVVPNVHETLSWRITRPLRQARTVQLKVAEIGFAPTMRIVATRVGQRVRKGGN